MSNFRMVMDVSAEDDPKQEKLRFAWYASLEEAIMQAEHELGLPNAQDRMRASLGPSGSEAELFPSGVRVLKIEDVEGNEVWNPQKGKTRGTSRRG